MGMYDSPARILRPDIPSGRRIIVTSDIHANLQYFNGLLSRAGFSDADELIIDGDFLEKGTESLATLRYIMDLSRRGNVHAVMGNCDDWSAIFSETGKWADNLPKYIKWRRSGLLWDMICGLGDDPMTIRDFQTYKYKLGEAYSDEFAFLSALPQAIETDRFIFAHAAVFPDKPLAAHTAGELMRCDRFMDLGFSFDKWVVVGHYPVMLYGSDRVCANPIIERSRRIVSIDGACVLKDDGQLNGLIIPDINSDDFSHTWYDPFPVRTVLSDQAESEHSYYIRWGDSRVQVLQRGGEFSHCRHVRTGYEMDILTKYLFTGEEFTDCNDCTDYVLPLHAGDQVSVVEETSCGYFVKHRGYSGWYFGKLG
ncbi:MAG: metallophosphoesterase [Candidatus Limivicinus sp.]|nr:metallophosphoesterase [Candidatus Limivicinus sp.]